MRFDANGRTAPNPFQDVRVRHAANHAIDIDGLIKSLQPGGDRTPALVNPLHFGYDASIKPHQYDPELAKKLLAEAGHASGFDVTWNTTTSQLMPNAKAVFEAMQQQLGKVGIRVKFQVNDARAQDERTRAGQNGPMMDGSWGSYSVFDADGILWDMLHSSSPFAYNENNGPRQAAARRPLDARRGACARTLYAKAQKIVRDEAPVLFMWGSTSSGASTTPSTGTGRRRDRQAVHREAGVVPCSAS